MSVSEFNNSECAAKHSCEAVQGIENISARLRFSSYAGRSEFLIQTYKYVIIANSGGAETGSTRVVKVSYGVRLSAVIG